MENDNRRYKSRHMENDNKTYRSRHTDSKRDLQDTELTRVLMIEIHSLRSTYIHLPSNTELT